MTNGPSFYDDPDVFRTYQEHRSQAENANATLEEPIFRQLVGTVAGLRIIDLGCGSAEIGRWMLQAGAARYTGIDGSRRMVELARETLRGTSAEVVEQDLATWNPVGGCADLIVSRLALHYLAHLDRTLDAAHRALVPGGRLIFSVEHPVITSCNRAYDNRTRRGEWIVDEYFVTGVREVQWLGGTVAKYHRTIEDYFSLVQRSGFAVESLRESRPDRAHFLTDEEHVRRGRIPLFLFVAARKAG